MTTPHKHQALIVAWAAGAEIEYLSHTVSRGWNETDRPGWGIDTEYRIKLKPNVVSWHSVSGDGISTCWPSKGSATYSTSIAVLRIEIDYNTTPPTLVSATLEKP